MQKSPEGLNREGCDMIKNEFLLMMEQDLQTHENKQQLADVLNCMKEILKSYPPETEIDSAKTAEGCFKAMREYAQKNQESGCYYFGHDKSVEFITDYLGLGKAKSGGTIDLFDFV